MSKPFLPCLSNCLQNPQPELSRWCTFLLLSILVTLNKNLNIFSSATSITASCLFVSAAVLKPYITAGLHYCLLNSSCYPSITNHPWHSSPRASSCLHFFNLSCALYSPLCCCPHTCDAPPSHTSLPLPLAPPQSLPWHPIIYCNFYRFTKTRCNSSWPSLHFSINTLKANITYVVLVLYMRLQQLYTMFWWYCSSAFPLFSSYSAAHQPSSWKHFFSTPQAFLDISIPAQVCHLNQRPFFILSISPY